jgi:hypothetical protein
MVTSDQIAGRADPCGGSSPHGYLGIETMVVQRISGWIRMADLREASFAQRTSRITLRQNLRPIRPPAGAPPKPPTPIRSWRRSPVTACQALLLETTSKGVSAGVKAVDRTRCLVFAAKFLGGDTGGQGQGSAQTTHLNSSLRRPSRNRSLPSHSALAMDLERRKVWSNDSALAVPRIGRRPVIGHWLHPVYRVRLDLLA